MTLVGELRAARIAQGRTVSDVARAANLNIRTLYNAEAAGSTTTTTLEPWAAALGFRVILVPRDADISAIGGSA